MPFDYENDDHGGGNEGKKHRPQEMVNLATDVIRTSIVLSEVMDLCEHCMMKTIGAMALTQAAGTAYLQRPNQVTRENFKENYMRYLNEHVMTIVSHMVDDALDMVDEHQRKKH